MLLSFLIGGYPLCGTSDCRGVPAFFAVAWPLGLVVLGVTTVAAFVDGLVDLYGRRRARE